MRAVVLTPHLRVSEAASFPRDKPGLQLPRLLRDVKPQYSADAMRERIQGAVWMEVTVLDDGTVGDVRVVESLDPRYGLDDKAVRAARQWRFLPATQDGRPISMAVVVEMTFTLK